MVVKQEEKSSLR